MRAWGPGGAPAVGARSARPAGALGLQLPCVSRSAKPASTSTDWPVPSLLHPEPDPDCTPRLVLTSDLDAGPHAPGRLLPSKPHTAVPTGFRHRHRPQAQPHPHPALCSLGHGSLPVSPGTRSPAPRTPPSSSPQPMPLSALWPPSDPNSRVRKKGAPMSQTSPARLPGPLPGPRAACGLPCCLRRLA